MKYKLLFGIILLIPVLMFVQMNIGEVPVRFLEWERMVPLSLLLTGTLLAGILLGMLFTFMQRRKKNKKLKKAEQEKLKAEQEAQREPAPEETTPAVEEETPLEAGETETVVARKD